MFRNHKESGSIRMDIIIIILDYRRWTYESYVGRRGKREREKKLILTSSVRNRNDATYAFSWHLARSDRSSCNRCQQQFFQHVSISWTIIKDDTHYGFTFRIVRVRLVNSLTLGGYINVKGYYVLFIQFLFISFRVFSYHWRS